MTPNKSAQAPWQRNYWARVIRNEKEGDRIRRYIEENPAPWFWDRVHVD